MKKHNNHTPPCPTARAHHHPSVHDSGRSPNRWDSALAAMTAGRLSGMAAATAASTRSPHPGTRASTFSAPTAGHADAGRVYTTPWVSSNAAAHAADVAAWRSQIGHAHARTELSTSSCAADALNAPAPGVLAGGTQSPAVHPRQPRASSMAHPTVAWAPTCIAVGADGLRRYEVENALCHMVWAEPLVLDATTATAAGGVAAPAGAAPLIKRAATQPTPSRPDPAAATADRRRPP